MRAIASTLRHPARRVAAARHLTTTHVPRAAPAPAGEAALRVAGAPPNWEVRVFYDGACPLCIREVNMLRERDASAGRIDFVDIDGPEFEAANPPINYEEAMKTIHAVKRDGTLLSGVPVFKELYDRVGLGWVYSFMSIPLLAKAASAVYNVWAALRLPITGRPPLDVVLREKQTCRND